MLTGVYTAAMPPIESPGLPKGDPLALRFRLIPRNEDFYAQFIALAAQLRIGADLLERMLTYEPVIWDKVDEIKEVEHKCDHLTHQIIQRLNSTFVTPIDREDIHALASRSTT